MAQSRSVANSTTFDFTPAPAAGFVVVIACCPVAVAGRTAPAPPRAVAALPGRAVRMLRVELELGRRAELGRPTVVGAEAADAGRLCAGPIRVTGGACVGGSG